jgi:multiple sugar transport system ATP-binding protein
LPPGHAVAVGLRPEHLRLQPSAEDALQVEARLQSIEPVGNEIFLALGVGGTAVTCRVPPQALPDVGAMLTVHYRPEYLRYFDALTGQRLR